MIHEVNLTEAFSIQMVPIPEGVFIMGSPRTEEDSYEDERPQHRVTIPQFYMSKYLITQRQWRVVMGNNPSAFKGDKRPVEQVSYNDALAFCAELSKLIEKAIRLPSEAEWEYACRANTTTPFYCGDIIATDLANYNGHLTYGDGLVGVYREETTDVGTFPPNPFGLCDMHGNLSEWCADVWHNNYENAPTNGKAWIDNGDQTERVVRGGSWFYGPSGLRSAFRRLEYAYQRSNEVGFRIVCSNL